MSQVSVPSSPSAAQSAGSPIVDYNARPAPRRASWLNVRVLLFVAVFGAIIGAPVYMFLDQSLTHGIHRRADGSVEVDLKSISLFPLDQQNGTQDDVPARFRELSGKKVVMVGEMWAPNASGDYVGTFDLCYSIAKCCFSGPPQAQHFVKTVAAKEGEAIPYMSGQVRCTGTLTVDVTHDAGKVNSVYHLKLESIEPI